MTDEEYIIREMNKARVREGTFVIKVRSDEGESRWVSIPARRFDSLVSVLTGGMSAAKE